MAGLPVSALPSLPIVTATSSVGKSMLHHVVYRVVVPFSFSATWNGEPKSYHMSSPVMRSISQLSASSYALKMPCKPSARLANQMLLESSAQTGDDTLYLKSTVMSWIFSTFGIAAQASACAQPSVVAQSSVPEAEGNSGMLISATISLCLSAS